MAWNSSADLWLCSRMSSLNLDVLHRTAAGTCTGGSSVGGCSSTGSGGHERGGRLLLLHGDGVELEGFAWLVVVVVVELVDVDRREARRRVLAAAVVHDDGRRPVPPAAEPPDGEAELEPTVAVKLVYSIL
jgi:hypothetical protein